MKMNYYDLEKGVKSQSIDAVFSGWKKGDERVAVFSPHDDDALLGAGYLMLSALENGGEVYVVIFCNGSAGYSSPEEKDIIVGVRAEETINSYAELGIPEKNIIRLNYEDFSVISNVGHKLPNGDEGAFPKIMKLMREYKITRAVVPNGYKEHIDHEAAFKISSYDSIQAGDPIFADWGSCEPLRSMLQYSVWADFDPAHTLVLKNGLRANKVVCADSEYEETIRKGIYAFNSQKKIIKGLVAQREERKYVDSYIEVFYEFDGRPKLEFGPYLEAVGKIDKG